MANESVIVNNIMNHLLSNFGVVDTEIFISHFIKEPFDYTEWQREEFDGISLDELNEAAVKYCLDNPMSEAEKQGLRE